MQSRLRVVPTIVSSSQIAMNSLIILPAEFVSDSEAMLQGERANYALERHELKVGIKVAASRLSGKRGWALVKAASRQKVVLEVFLDKDPPQKADIELIVAVPRPQTVKKIILAACCLGVGRIHFLKTANVVKSYLQSKSLQPENIQQEIIKGLEQAFDTVPPEVLIHSHYPKFIRESLPKVLGEKESANPIKLIADTRVSSDLTSKSVGFAADSQPVVIAIGPESGWTAEEAGDFKNLGFISITLGERILRVDAAATVLIAQVNLLRLLKPELNGQNI